jgi:hypothetical protein
VLELCKHRSLEKFLRKYRHKFQKCREKEEQLKSDGYILDDFGSEHDSGFGEVEPVFIERLNEKLLVEWATHIARGMEHISSLNVGSKYYIFIISPRFASSNCKCK